MKRKLNIGIAGLILFTLTLGWVLGCEQSERKVVQQSDSKAHIAVSLPRQIITSRIALSSPAKAGKKSNLLFELQREIDPSLTSTLAILPEFDLTASVESDRDLHLKIRWSSAEAMELANRPVFWTIYHYAPSPNEVPHGEWELLRGKMTVLLNHQSEPEQQELTWALPLSGGKETTRHYIAITGKYTARIDNPSFCAEAKVRYQPEKPLNITTEEWLGSVFIDLRPPLAP